MKHTLLAILCLLSGLQSCTKPEPYIAQMTTTRDSIKIYVEWTGAGSIYANGVELKNDTEWASHNADIETVNTIPATADGSVVLTATGDAQLTRLRCNSNQLVALDVTNCPKLEVLHCHGNYLTTLDVTNCPDLTHLLCHFNSLSALDVTNCIKLENVSASNQTILLPIARINDDRLSIKNPFAGSKVKINNISDNGIDTGNSLVWVRERESGKVTFDFTAIDGSLSGTATLPWTKTEPSGKMQAGVPVVAMTTTNDLVRINVKWTGSGKLIANGVELTNSDVTENISYLSIYDPDATDIIYPSIDGLVVVTATGDAQLTYLNCWGNSLTDLDITNCPELTHLYCDINDLTTLDLTNCPKLIELSCNKRYCKDIIESTMGCIDLEKMYGYKAPPLTSLDLTNCPELTMLSCWDNSLTTLDLTNCPKLKYLNCGKNYLTNLNVTKCTELTELHCLHNALTILDVTKCTGLLRLECGYNSLTSLDITKCTELIGLECSDNPLQTLDIANCRKLADLYCNGNSLTILDVTNCPKLQSLYCYNNSLTTLDVTKCPRLTSLHCSYNSLSALDITNCPRLDILHCDNNSLIILDLTKCPKLLRLECNNNSLIALDITKCPELSYMYADNQAPVLPVVQTNGTELSIRNPVTFVGSRVYIDSISHNGTYTADNIIWKVSGEDGEVTFGFKAGLPSDVLGRPFSGTVTQPWTKK